MAGEATMRQRTLTDNVRLVRYFVWKKVPRRLIAELGGYSSLVADLYEPYVEAVDSWLASKRTHTLATYVFNRLRWFLLREVSLRTFIYVPDCPVKRPKLKAWKKLILSTPVVSLEDVSPDLLERSTAVRPDEGIDERLDAAALIGAALDSIQKPRIRKVIELRYGLGSDEHTLMEAAKKLSITRERVRQIEARGILNIRRHFERLRMLPPAPPDSEMKSGTGNDTDLLRNIRIWSAAQPVSH